MVDGSADGKRVEKISSTPIAVWSSSRNVVPVCEFPVSTDVQSPWEYVRVFLKTTAVFWLPKAGSFDEPMSTLGSEMRDCKSKACSGRSSQRPVASSSGNLSQIEEGRSTCYSNRRRHVGWTPSLAILASPDGRRSLQVQVDRLGELQGAGLGLQDSSLTSTEAR